MTFHDIYEQLRWDDISEAIQNTSAAQVRACLERKRHSIEDAVTLLSPAAAPYLEEMAQLAHTITVRRFGRTIQLYVPMYLSNECNNICTYCGFSFPNKIKRHTLSVDEAFSESMILHRHGFRHILLLTGEEIKEVGVDYIEKVIRKLKSHFSSISIEVQPLSTDEYRRLIAAGVDGLTVYQETYEKETYDNVHLKGKKRNFKWRLETADRGGTAGIRRLNIGALFGLSANWRTEGFYIAQHAAYLLKHYWMSQIMMSFPRLRPAEGEYIPKSIVHDTNLVQLICAMRILFPDAGLVLSTRESQEIRNRLIPLGITMMSAGSRTNPGGYSDEYLAGKQFEIDDERSPAQVADVITGLGYEPVWKDWDREFLTT